MLMTPLLLWQNCGQKDINSHLVKITAIPAVCCTPWFIITIINHESCHRIFKWQKVTPSLHWYWKIGDRQTRSWFPRCLKKLGDQNPSIFWVWNKVDLPNFMYLGTVGLESTKSLTWSNIIIRFYCNSIMSKIKLSFCRTKIAAEKMQPITQ
jgi:hypothetical protein